LHFTYKLTKGSTHILKNLKLLTTASCWRGWSNITGLAVLVVGTHGTTAWGVVVDDVVGVVVLATPATALAANPRR